MIKTLIVEDELHNRKNLENLLKKYCADINVIASAGNSGEAIEIINRHNPQLIFLDIQMPGKDGFQMLQELNKYDFEIIFVTAYSEYGIKAIKFSAIDYLLKPLNIDELINAVNKAIHKIKQKQENENLKNLLHYLSHENDRSNHRIAIASLKEIRLIPIKEINRAESANSYTYFYLSNNEKILATIPISTYEELLTPYGFVRCHQSHLVNKNFVKSFLRTDGYALLMTDGSEVPVSRHRKDMVKMLLLT